jgi:hypothetical protein
LQSNCPGLYADIDSFIVHIKKNHKDVRVTDDFLGENFNNNKDEDPLPDHLNRPNENLNIDANVDDIEGLRPVERECYKKKSCVVASQIF